MGEIRRMAAVACAALLLVPAALAGTSVADTAAAASRPELAKAPDDIAQNAGSAAGLAAACGDDPVPVRAAFALYLGRRHGNAGEQQRLWSRLSLAETSTIRGIPGSAAPACDNVHETVLREVRLLERAD